MSKIFVDYSKDIDTPEEHQRRQTLIERIERKVEYKEALQASASR